ncbi:MAG TPA: hypothetical protein VGA29_08110, partial [Ignavibacteriaceae bacterium]
MKNIKIFAVFLLFIAAFAGCEQNPDSINGPLNKNDFQSLSKKGSNVHAVYTLSNSAAGNEVIMFKRSGRGTLTSAGSF